MKKIPSVFQRNHDGDELLRDEVTPGCEWVLAGEGVATRKFDGTACLIRDGRLYKRYDAKRGKAPPPGFIPAQEPDEVTGHHPGWLALGAGPEDQWFLSVLPDVVRFCADGTYELCGPKINTNPERLSGHVLVRHGDHVLVDVPRTFAGLAGYLRRLDAEGIVFHHPDGRMAKAKKRDWGFAWGVAKEKK